MKTTQFKEFIRYPYAWPGGYPMYAIMADGGAICKNCAKSEWRNICHSMLTNCRDGWLPEAIDINYENLIYCDHCGEQIESAYEIDPTPDCHACYQENCDCNFD